MPIDPRAAALDPFVAERFRALCNSRTLDIAGHLGTLWGLARQCEHVTEFGVREGVSTCALLAGQPATLHLYDLERRGEVCDMEQHAGRTRIIFHTENTLGVTIEPTELLHIDTVHEYDQVSVELANNAARVSRWLAFHDTTTFGAPGDKGGRGLWPAIEELIAAGEWKLLARWHHDHGFTVLERV